MGDEMVLEILRNDDFKLLTLIAKIIKMTDNHYGSINVWPFSYWPCYMPEDGCYGPRQRRGSLQPSEAILNTRANMKKVIIILILVLTNFNREYIAGMSLCFSSKLKAFSLSIVSSFLQLPITYHKANVERPSIDFKLFNRKGCLILSIKSKHRLPNFQLVFHQLC